MRLHGFLEGVEIIQQGLGERVELLDGLPRAGEGHLDSTGRDRHTGRQAGQPDVLRRRRHGYADAVNATLTEGIRQRAPARTRSRRGAP